MPGRAKKRLAVAVANHRAGYVYCKGDTLTGFGLSLGAVQSVESAFIETTKWIRHYRPREVITEECLPNSRKSKRTQALIAAVGAAAEDSGVKHIQVVRVKRFKNKYEEAAAIAVQYAELMDWLPKHRRNFEAEKPQIIYFEAMSLWLAHVGIFLPNKKKAAEKDEGTMSIPSLISMSFESLL